MLKNPVFAIFAIISTVLLTIPARAFVYPDGYEDAKFEQYGPRADELLIHLYANDNAEFEALKAHEIDIYDWPLSKTQYQELIKAPHNTSIKVVNYGPEYGLYILDMNQNNNSYLGSPPDPAYPNPQYVTGPGKAHAGNWLADVWLRRAIDFLIDRPGLIADPSIGADFGYPMYTTMPPSQAKYLLDIYGNTSAPWAWKYDPVACNATLDAHGYTIGASGKREYRGDVVKLKVYIRSDHTGRNHTGQVIVANMAAAGFDTSDVHYATSATTYTEVMVNKDFHMYTGGCSLSVDPDMSLWNWAYYWHPGFCYNYAGCNDAEFNAAADNLPYPNSQAEAVAYCIVAQWRQAYMVLGAPLYCVSGNKAYHRWNTGSNPDPSTGQDWLGVVNQKALGVDNRWSFLSMHTNLTDFGNGTGITIDWGFKVPAFTLLNPVYASWLWDWNMLNQIYESLLLRNASDQSQWLPWIAENYIIGTYTHPVYGDCTKIKFTLSPEVSWSDGYPLTVTDVYFTFVEIRQILHSRGFPNPWWWSNVQDVLGFKILDAWNFEVLLDVKSYWALGWIGGNIILPKHIWKPIALTGDPQMDYRAHPEIFVGSGPWKLVSYNEPAGLAQLVGNPNFHRNGPIVADIKCNVNHLNKFIPSDGLDPVIVRLHNGAAFDSIDQIEYAVEVNDTIAATGADVTIPANGGLEINVPMNWTYGRWFFHVDVWWRCKWPPTTQVCPMTGRRYKLHFTIVCYCTIKEDFAGSNFYDDLGFSDYPYKNELPTPDAKVELRDLVRVSGSFGSYPGHSRWNYVCDITGDYRIDIQDLARTYKKFGW